MPQTTEVPDGWATGPGIDIYAPAWRLPVTNNSCTGVTDGDGTCFATPQVSSLAAIVRSINGNMSGAALKAAIFNGATTFQVIPGDYSSTALRLNLFTPIRDAMIGRNVPEITALLKECAPPPLSICAPRPASSILRDMCNFGVNFQFNWDPWNWRKDVLGTITPEPQFEWHSPGKDGSQVDELLSGCDSCRWHLKKDGVFGWTPNDADPMPTDKTWLTYRPFKHDPYSTIIAKSLQFGYLAFTDCRVDEREHSAADHPTHITGSGYFWGRVKWELDGDDYLLKTMRGKIQTTIAVTGDAATWQYIEDNCRGGVPRDQQ